MGKQLLQKINDKIQREEPFFSFEFFPPKTEEGTLNLYDRIERMRILGPTWLDITWGAGGSSSEKTLDICKTLVDKGLEVMMHLTCTNVSAEAIAVALEKAREVGVKSILALRGDPSMKEIFDGNSGFHHAVDLVRFIREKYGDYFTIAVAGYPEGHYSSKSFDEDIFHLKEKVDAGADLIITQLCYDVDMFEMFVRECKEAGIGCPIVAGLMPIYSYERFERITHLTQVIIPEDLIRRLYPIKGTEEAVKELGISFLCEMVNTLLQKRSCAGFHFYTLNLEKSVTKILRNTNLIASKPKKAEETEKVPKKHYMHLPKSEWDDFPNERWGDERSPAFGNLINEVWYSSLENNEISKELLERSQGISTEEDVFQIFGDFCEGKLSALPWAPERLSSESSDILDQLRVLNREGFLTINSQPAVNALPSTDKTYGWGDDFGYVYQKAYVEFFCSPSHWERLKVVLNQKKFRSVTYLASKLEGETESNPPKQKNVLTWGIFSGKEVIQTTLVGIESFDIWKKEAFSIWQKGWISKLDPRIFPKASTILRQMMESFYLVNIVENDYVKGNLFQIFQEVKSV